MDFKGFRSFESLRYSEAQLQSLVKHTTPNPPSIRLPNGDDQEVNASAESLCKLLSRLGCSTILVEKNYTDRDYKAEFSAFYAKRFSLPSAICTRLHFFSEPLASYGIITSPEQIARLTAGQSFLGFCVVRPTEFFRIGRTVVQFTPPSVSSAPKKEYYVTCLGWHTVHLFGKELRVLGMPFIQQDTQVGACAHASLWMVGRYMHGLGHCAEISMQQINQFAKARQPRGRHYPAQDGLVSVQMLDALHEMGLSAKHYNNFNITKHKDRYTSVSDFIANLIYYYVESSFPVIIEFDEHVVVAIGHTLNVNRKLSTKIAERIPSFIVHDDIAEQYGEFELVGGPDKQSFVDIRGLIAVIPSSVHLQGEYAEAFVHVVLGELSSKEGVLVKTFNPEWKSEFRVPTPFRLRTYILKATVFLTELQRDSAVGRAPKDIVNLVLRMELPTYIWVSEVYELVHGRDCQTGRCVGKVVLDSTAAAWDKCVIAVLMERVVLLFDRQHLVDSPVIQKLAGDSRWEHRPRDRDRLSGS